jgi:hypothetical protein
VESVDSFVAAKSASRLEDGPCSCTTPMSLGRAHRLKAGAIHS